MEGLEVGTPISSRSLHVLPAQAPAVCEQAFLMIPASISGLTLSLQIFAAEAPDAEKQKRVISSPPQNPDLKCP